MRDSSHSTWPVPALTRAGQEIFWDRQASSYGGADMTLDNEGELALVRRFTKDFLSQGFACDDVVTLGGAIGCRDPRVVMEELALAGKTPRAIFFNDLSTAMVKEAFTTSLLQYQKSGTEIKAIPGAIHEIASQIPPKPRRIILGVYSASALVTPKPEEKFSRAGLDEYVHNRAILGDRFILEPVRFKDGGWRGMGERTIVMSGARDPLPASTASVKRYLRERDMGAVRVIGEHAGLSGYFLSHWFSEMGITQLVRECFNAQRQVSMRMLKCAKGFVLCIDPIAPPQGIVTILNNVVGNVIPHEQMMTLRAIDALSS